MTAQFNDSIKIGTEYYAIAGIKGRGLFDPATLGIKTTMMSTACYRGYTCTYALLDHTLCLTELHVSVLHTSNKPYRAPTLILVDDRTHREVQRLELETWSVLLGSAPGCDLQINDVAPRHCRIVPGEPFQQGRPMGFMVQALNADQTLLLGEEGHYAPEECRTVHGASKVHFGDVLNLGQQSIHFLWAPCDPGPQLFGIDPVYHHGHSKYSDMSAFVPFTGGLLAARDFIEELYVHMGFHPAWKYGVVRELLFEDGHLTGDFDRSAKIAQLRAKLQDRLTPTTTDPATLREWIGKCFDRDYGF
jgi:hypothetical protein